MIEQSMTLSGKLVLVTGASRGLGYQAAKSIAGAGAHIIALARTVGGLEDLDDEIRAAGGEATLVPLDVTDGDGIDRLAHAIWERWGRLDGLVMNAGIMSPVSPVGHIKPKDFERALSVNLTANFRLLRAFDPLLRQSETPRVIALSAKEATSPPAFFASYAASKAGFKALVESYIEETKNTSVRVNFLEPLPHGTALRAKQRPGENQDTLPKPSELASSFIKLLLKEQTETGETYTS